jgi:hypothetical protein
MKNYKSIISGALILLLIFSLNVKAAFDVQGVGLFRDSNLCVLDSSQNPSAVTFASIQTSQDSAIARTNSSGAFCKPSIFTGGAILSNSSGKVTQAQPVVQANGRGILITEPFGPSGAVSSSGDPTAFNSLLNKYGGSTMLVFEIALPQGCDVIDDDDDGEGTASVLSGINDFSFPTCSATGGLNVFCNDLSSSGLLTASNVLVPASGSTPAKVRFGITSVNFSADSNLIDSILIKFDSQDIFCSSSAISPLTATITAKNAIDSPTLSETIGTADFGAPIKALDVSGSASSLLISELDNDSIPVGNTSSQSLIDPISGLTTEITMINLWIVPSATNIFSTAPSSSDVIFSDTSLALSSAPFIVRSSSDDNSAPTGTVVIPIKKNDISGALSPAKNKTTITIKNLGLSSTSSSGSSSGSSSSESSISVLIYEPNSQAVVNTPGVASINNTSSSTNPQNYSAFSYLSTRAQNQTAVISNVVNETSMLTQPLTDADLALVFARNTILGSPQIINFTSGIASSSSGSSGSSSSSGASGCEQTVCGCSDVSCTPTSTQIQTFIDSNGGLSSIISTGGALLNELISAAKKLLGLS